MHHRSTFVLCTTVMHWEEGMARKDPQFNLRLPEELKVWVERSAKGNCRSMTAEVVFWLQQAKKIQEQAA
ncbi:Arc family DNA-binding protein [Pseudomonas sp.]|uniref:Arc family DNA-binding protein n=1 Tax=Pseudomonas sp. TaxID=306 RepID=UPI00289B1323|nr:Arc family DNA-binding protein [Pseudomonas sp.]